MKLLLDTHIIIAFLERQESKLSVAVSVVIANENAQYIASVASLWEIAIKARLGKLNLQTNLEKIPGSLNSMQINILPIETHHVLELVEPEPATRDPFDRLLLAQCQADGMKLVTIDRALSGHRLSATA